MIVGPWALQDTFGVTAAFLGRSIRETAKGYPSNKGHAPWTYNVGAANSLGV